MGMNENLTDVSVPRAGAMLAEIEPTAQPTSRTPQLRDNSVERIAFQPSRTLLSPSAALVWLLGSLGVAACMAPWLARGWRWFDVIAAVVVLVGCYDAFALWFARKKLRRCCCRQKKNFADAKGRASRFRSRWRAPGGGDRAAKSDLQSWRPRERAKPP